MKIQFDVTELEKVPEDWPQPSKWPGAGVYVCKSEPTTIYIVNDYTVAYVPSGMMMARKVEEAGAGLVDEQLVLKLMAAANGRTLNA